MKMSMPNCGTRSASSVGIRFGSCTLRRDSFHLTYEVPIFCSGKDFLPPPEQPWYASSLPYSDSFSKYSGQKELSSPRTPGEQEKTVVLSSRALSWVGCITTVIDRRHDAWKESPSRGWNFDEGQWVSLSLAITRGSPPPWTDLHAGTD